MRIPRINSAGDPIIPIFSESLDERAAETVQEPSDEKNGGRSKLMPGALSINLLTLLLRKPKTAFVVVGLVAFVLAFWLIQLGNPAPSRGESIIARLGDESQTAAISLFIALLIVPTAIVLVLRKMFVALISIARESAEKGRGPVLPFLAETMEQMADQLDDLHGEGVEVESYDVANWVRRCFQTAGPSIRYLGTDSHVPSEYEDVYTDYLQAQRRFLKKSNLTSHARIMIVEMGTLRSDKFGSDSYQRFVAWHDNNKVRLAQIEPTVNQAQLALPGQPHDLVDTDIGFWENKYVLLFKPVRMEGERERTLLRIAYFGEPLYAMCSSYVNWIENKAINVGDELPFYPEKLSIGWEHFCDPSERIKHTIPFLEQIIQNIPRNKDDIRIFDAATGIGIETTELIKLKYFVAANEIESSLREAANDFARKHSVRIPAARFSHTDWLHLDDEHDRGTYDLVLVLGNSLCHLEGLEQLKVAVEQFARRLRPGGALVCDERNFDYILKNWHIIHQDAWNNFRFNRREAKDRVMYYGDTVLGAPVNQTDKGRIIFSYCEVERNENDGRITPRGDGELGTLTMYPFKKGDMLNALRETHQFKSIDIYSDLKPTADLDDEADFYTYVAWKT